MSQELVKNQGASEGAPSAPQTKAEKIKDRAEKAIAKLNERIEDAEREKHLLAEMASECTSGKKFPRKLSLSILLSLMS